jgi:hypothetical protein
MAPVEERMDRDKALDVLGNAMADRGRLTDEREAEVGQAVMSLLGTLLVDVARISDAAEKLANPPEIITADFLEAKPDTRTVEALERIADALEVSNAANMTGAQLDVASPGRLMMVQAICETITKRLKVLVGR